MKRTIYIFAAILLFLSTAAFSQSEEIITTGLNHPNKVILGPLNSVLVSEDGTSDPNTGRISMIDQRSGRHRTLIEGLPSAVSMLGGSPEADGVTSVYLDGLTLYATIGIGDGAIPGPGPGLESPNPTPSSPLFDSVIEFDFPFGLGFIDGGFQMTMADQNRLAQGRTVWLSNGRWSLVRARVVADLPDYIAAPTPDHPDNAKASHIYAMTMYRGDIYLSDSGLNRITRIKRSRHQQIETVYQFPSIPNPTPVGAPFIEAVPDNIHTFGDRLMLPTLTGFPFVPGLAGITSYNPRNGTASPFISGLSAAMDVAESSHGRHCFFHHNGRHNGYFTLEFSTDMLGGAPGRLRYYRTPDATPDDISTDLITPGGMAVNDRTDTIFVTGVATGLLTRIHLQ